MIAVRRATASDAAAMGDIHVGAWRSTYAGILPDGYLANLSPARNSTWYRAGILRGHPALVAELDGRVVGFTTFGLRPGHALGGGEIETLYVGEDGRERGVGRSLMAGAAGALAERGAPSAFLWVLSSNPSRWFYLRIGGRRAADGTTEVAGNTIGKTAFVWDPIGLLLTAPIPPGVTE